MKAIKQRGMLNAPPPQTGNKPKGVTGAISLGYSKATAAGNHPRKNAMVSGNASRKR